MSNDTKAALFAKSNPYMELPPEVKSAVLILVFDDDSIHASVPKGSDSDAEVALASAMDLYGTGDGARADLHTVSTLSMFGIFGDTKVAEA